MCSFCTVVAISYCWNCIVPKLHAYQKQCNDDSYTTLQKDTYIVHVCVCVCDETYYSDDMMPSCNDQNRRSFYFSPSSPSRMWWLCYFINVAIKCTGYIYKTIFTLPCHIHIVPVERNHRVSFPKEREISCRNHLIIQQHYYHCPMEKYTCLHTIDIYKINAQKSPHNKMCSLVFQVKWKDGHRRQQWL